MTTALAILATAALALAAIHYTTRRVIREARAAIDQARDPEPIAPEQLAAIRPALAVLDHHQEQTAATLRRFAGTDPTTAAEIAAELHRAAVDKTRREDDAA